MDPANDFPDTQQVLSQSEVERLLAQVAEQQNSVVVHKDGIEKERRPNEAVQPYDFRHPVFLSASELRKLRLRHEDFIRTLAARFAIYLRMDFSLQMSKLQTVTFQKFTETLANPTFVTLFKVEPLRGISILEIHPRLGLTIVDRLLGGPGHSVNPDRDLSDIEQALIDQAVSVVLSEWCNHWSGVQELRPVLLGHETSGRFLQTAAHDTVMLVLSMEARLGDCMEQLQIALPYYTLEPLIRQLNQGLESNARESTKTVTRPRWNDQFDTVKVPITAEWQGLELSARQILDLKPGDVLQLDPACSHQVCVRLGDLPKFVGQIGVQGERWAVQLTDIVKP